MTGRAVVVGAALAACGRLDFESHRASDAGGDGSIASGSLCTTHWCWDQPPPPDEQSLRAIRQ